jgi:hypothetical protein
VVERSGFVSRRGNPTAGPNPVSGSDLGDVLGARESLQDTRESSILSSSTEIDVYGKKYSASAILLDTYVKKQNGC